MVADVSNNIQPNVLSMYVYTVVVILIYMLYTITQTHTSQVCEGMCRDAGGDMYGLQYGSECFCGDSRDTDIERHGRTECDMLCSGDDSVTCGGREFYYCY